MMKNILKKIALISYFIVLFSTAFVSDIRIAEASSSSLCPKEGLICCTKPPDCTFSEFVATFERIVSEIIKISLYFVAIIFVMAGYLYLTSGGDQGKITKAHNMFTKVVIGLIIILSAYLVVEGITKILGLDSDLVKSLI